MYLVTRCSLTDYELERPATIIGEYDSYAEARAGADASDATTVLHILCPAGDVFETVASCWRGKWREPLNGPYPHYDGKRADEPIPCTMKERVR